MRHQRSQCVAGRFCVIEVALIVHLQAHCKLVKMVRHLMVIVEILKIVDFQIPVQIMQNTDLVAAINIDFFVHDLQTEWLK